MEQTLFSLADNGHRLEVRSFLVREPVNFLLIGDPHLGFSDERDDGLAGHMARMKKYITPAADAFRGAVSRAPEKKCAAVLIPGDAVSFPAMAAVETVSEIMHFCKVPCLFTSGNHDWHLEGMPGSEIDLRREWTARRLMPLYPEGADPLIYARDLAGIRIIMLDNSVYQILPEQLEKLKSMLADGLPSIIVCHIPFFLPGRNIFSCGNPDWNWDHDPYFEIERRERWPKEGPSDITMQTRELVLSAPNVLGIAAGHVHELGLDIWQEKFQLTLPRVKTSAEDAGVLTLLPLE